MDSEDTIPEDIWDMLNDEEEVLAGEDEDGRQLTLEKSLKSLPLFGDFFLGMQALNLDLVDTFLEDAEKALLHEYFELEKTPPITIFVSAVSQLWIFGLYELLRTWRQRAFELLRFAASLTELTSEETQERIRQQKNKLQKDAEPSLGLSKFLPFDQATDGEFISHLQSRFDQTEILFRSIEALRVSLAKHEVPKSKGIPALAPGYGRIDMTNGSIYWQIILQGNQVDLVSRRSIADKCRRLLLDRSDRILSLDVQKKVLALPREAYGITRVIASLKDGTERPNVFVAWGKEIIGINGGASLDAREVVDVKPAPQDTESNG